MINQYLYNKLIFNKRIDYHHQLGVIYCLQIGQTLCFNNQSWRHSLWW